MRMKKPLISVSLCAVALAGCATNPSALSTEKVSKMQPASATYTHFIQAHCHENACNLPIRLSSVPIKNPGVDLIVASRAAMGEGKLVPEKPGSMMAFPDDFTPADVPTTNLVSNAGVVATGAGFGDAGIALGVLGMMTSASHYHPAKKGYRISPTIPYLSFYRFYPSKWLGSETMQDMKPAIEQGVDLLVKTHDGQRMAPGSLDFSGEFTWGDKSQFSGVRHFALAQSSGVLRNSLLISWAAGGDVTNCYVAAFSFDGNFAVAVRTGQPKSFYMPAQVEKILTSIPDSGRWYAVFNMPGQYDLIGQYAIHDGKMYRIHISPPTN